MDDKQVALLAAVIYCANREAEVTEKAGEFLEWLKAQEEWHRLTPYG